MSTFSPAPRGLEAPETLPASPSAVSAEATGLGGTDSVTLIATPSQEPVNSPLVAKAAADPASDLGTFSTTAASSASAANTHVLSQVTQLMDSCSGSGSSVKLGTTGGYSCSSAQGPIINFNSGNWLVQVQDLDGQAPPTAEATEVAKWLAVNVLPAANKGLVSLSVPGTAQAGSAPTCQLVWSEGADDYSVTGRGTDTSALELAASLRPWPRG